MSLSNLSTKVQYATNGIATVFAFTVPFILNSHVKVVLTTAGVDATLAESVDYTLTGAGNPAGGTVTCVVAPANGLILTIKRIVPMTQLASYVANDAFPSASHEQALDILTMICQQLLEITGRCVQFPDGELSAHSPLLPAASARANKALKFDGTGLISVS